MVQALAYATQLIGVLPGLIAAGKDVMDMVKNGNAALQAMKAEKRDPSAQEWQDLNDQIAALQTQLHHP